MMRFFKRSLPTALLPLALTTLLLGAESRPAGSDTIGPDAFWAPEAFAAQREYEEALIGLVQPNTLRRYHDLFASEPHVAGTPGDLRLISRMVEIFETMGLEVERHEFHALLAYPIRAELSIESPVQEDLPLDERPIEGDPQTAHPDLPPGFSAYSGSGEVTAEIVYANYGRKEDFERLRELGISVEDRIVLARFGGNYRGYKARFAEEAGAAGLLMYTDPANAGYMRGLPYPEGGWANETSIERGSILTLPYPGDPLTPFIEATKDAPRLAIEDVDLPSIPVQPISWKAAHRIKQQMTGAGLPSNFVRDWQGGLPLAYRIEGGPDLRVRLLVEQERRIMPTANVIATLRGSTEPDRWIILGCHHDAWGIGAGDPLAGLICLFEAARIFSELAEEGFHPARSILFAAWGAEEYGIIGSTEWVESRRDALLKNAVTYINLDMAAMGPNFRASATPSLARVIRDAARVVPSVNDPERTVWEEWSQDDSRVPPVGDLGGGSDHLPFVCHVGIASAAFGAGGSHGTAYHTNNDTLGWYRLIVGDDYESARMITRMTLVTAARLASADLLPLDPLACIARVRRELDALAQRAAAHELPFPRADVDRALTAYESTVTDAWPAAIDRLRRGELDREHLTALNRALLGFDRGWLDPSGLTHRGWYRNMFVATDESSGYRSWILPALHEALEDHDPARVALMLRRYERILTELTHHANGLRPE